MKLLIVSHTPHHAVDGTIVGWGPTVREIDHLSRYFSRVVHVAPVHPGPPLPIDLPYSSSKVIVRRVSPSGGASLPDKLGVVAAAPRYAGIILEEIKQADCVHVRCPASIALIALGVLFLRARPRPRWAKYAGNWSPLEHEPLSYRLQRWILLNRLHRGPVTVNGSEIDQAHHVVPMANPCLTDPELAEARSLSVQRQAFPPVQLLFVGRVEVTKGVGRALDIAALLRQHGVDLELHIVGDGPQRPGFEVRARRLGLQVFFHGWASRRQLAHHYARTHFLLLPTTSSEGWPKVLSEAMAFGAVPLASAISSIGDVLSRLGAGIALPPRDPQAYVRAILELLERPDRWMEMSHAGMAGADEFTYEVYLQTLARMFQTCWRVTLPADENR